MSGPGKKYSICATIYNSAPLLEKALEPLLKLDDSYEIVIVDNLSNDGTMEILKKYEQRTKFQSFKCTRGRGRQRAMELSSGEVIIHLDLDVAYENLFSITQTYQTHYSDIIVNLAPEVSKCNVGIYIGKRSIFDKLGGFPDLNNSDDAYFNKIAEAFGLIKYVKIDLQHKCLELRGLLSGQESRYEKNRYKKLKRRILSTRDILFVQGFDFKGLIKHYKLQSAGIIIYGLPLYIIGKLLTLTIKVPKVKTKIQEIQKNENFRF